MKKILYVFLIVFVGGIMFFSFIENVKAVPPSQNSNCQALSERLSEQQALKICLQTDVIWPLPTTYEREGYLIYCCKTPENPYYKTPIIEGSSLMPTTPAVQSRPKVPRDNSKCPTTGLVPCGTEGCPCQFCDFFVMTNNIVKWIFTFVPIIAALMLAIGGGMFFFAGAKPDMLRQAKGVITSVVIGLIIIFAAWVIVNTVIGQLGIVKAPSVLQWYNIGCKPP